MNSKPYLLVFVSAFGLTIISSVTGNILESEGVLTAESLGPEGIEAVMSFYFLMFIIMTFSLVPLVIRFFIKMQIKIGNGEFFLIKWFQTHERCIVYGFWGLIIVGFVIIFSLVEPADLFK
jgi:hypothetical protein